MPEHTTQLSVKRWWPSLAAGIIYIIVGVLVFVYPKTSYLALSKLFIAGFGVLGVLGIYYSLTNRKLLQHWEWNFMTALIDLAITFLLLVNPKITMFVLPLYVGFVLFFRSVIGIGFSAYLAHYKVRNWGIVLLLSIFGVVFSLLMIWNPILGAFTLTLYTAFAFLTVGFGQIGVAYELHRHKKLFDNDED